MLKLPEVYDYPSFILSNSLKQCFKMNENKSVLKNILKKIPDFNIDLLKETKPY